MSLDQKIALFSAMVSFIGLVFVGLQLRAGTRQQMSDSLVKILDTTRELISLGFSHPKLFEILAGKKETDPILTQRYLHLWLNHFSLVHSYLEHSMLGAETRDNLERDLTEFMGMASMRKHWQRFGSLYPISFQTFIDEILKKDEPPTKAAHHDETAHEHHDAKT